MKSVLTGLLAVCIAGSLASTASAEGAYGGMYVTGGSTAQALAVTAAKMTGFVTALPGSATFGDTAVSEDVANDEIDLDAGGVYLIHLDVTAQMGTADIAATLQLAGGGTVITGATCSLIGEVAGADTNTSMTWLYVPATDLALSVYVKSASATPDFTPVNAQLIVHKIR